MEIPPKTPRNAALNLINFLEAAYRSSDPIRSLDSVPATEELLNLLLPTTSRESLEERHPPDLYNDLLAHWKQGKLSEVAIQCKFQYFATSMTVVWGNGGMVAYVEPNRPLPYAWINVNAEDQTVQLRSCGGGTPSQHPLLSRFRVILHVTPRRKSGEPMGLVKVAFDTSHPDRDPIVFSQGSAVQLALRLDLDVPAVEFVKPNPDFECVVHVTLNGNWREGSVYHRTKDKLIHSVLPK